MIARVTNLQIRNASVVESLISFLEESDASYFSLLNLRNL